jgi:hypothetical protein
MQCGVKLDQAHLDAYRTVNGARCCTIWCYEEARAALEALKPPDDDDEDDA